MLFFIKCPAHRTIPSEHGFNTSHVILYQNTKRTCGLSKKFQYISCYSLSTLSAGVLLRLPCFNTSHVILYHSRRVAIFADEMFQYISCYSLSQSDDYLYLDNRVSIHLMLFFIILNTLSRF